MPCVSPRLALPASVWISTNMINGRKHSSKFCHAENAKLLKWRNLLCSHAWEKWWAVDRAQLNILAPTPHIEFVMGLLMWCRSISINEPFPYRIKILNYSGRLLVRDEQIMTAGDVLHDVPLNFFVLENSLAIVDQYGRRCRVEIGAEIWWRFKHVYCRHLCAIWRKVREYENQIPKGIPFCEDIKTLNKASASTCLAHP